MHFGLRMGEYSNWVITQCRYLQLEGKGRRAALLVAIAQYGPLKYIFG